MAWTDITNEQVDPGSPVDTALMTAIRDNITAIAEGAAGAPALTGIFGGGATWQNLTGSRAASTSYQNTTGNYIYVAITAAINREVQVSVDNSTWIRVGKLSSSSSTQEQVSFPVPNLWYYRINGSVNGLYWAELR